VREEMDMFSLLIKTSQLIEELEESALFFEQGKRSEALDKLMEADKELAEYLESSSALGEEGEEQLKDKLNAVREDIGWIEQAEGGPSTT